MIKAEALIAKFRQALDEHWGYIWGTAGEKWTSEKQKELEKTTDANRAQGRQYGSKWIGHRVADCSGLFSWAFRQLGGTIYHGSDTMYRKCCVNKGELSKGKRTDRGTLKPGTAVFVWNGSSYSHVGLYAGSGIVIEAMSTLKGVTTTKVTAGKWTHWGELQGVDYSDSSDEIIKDAEPSTVGKAWPALRKGCKGKAVKECQILLEKHGYSVGSCGIDGKFGKDTLAAVKAFQNDHGLEVDGIVGPITRKELMKT